jgi:hypothetical protein
LFNGSYVYIISFMQNTFDFHCDCCLKQKNLDPCCKLSYIMLSIPWPSCAYWGKATSVCPSMDNNVPKKNMKMGIMVLKSSLENDWATKVKKHRVNLEASRRSRHDMIYRAHSIDAQVVNQIPNFLFSIMSTFILLVSTLLSRVPWSNMPRSKSSFEKVSFDGHCSISGDLTESAPVRLKQ